jgi:hypothetical protein
MNVPFGIKGKNVWNLFFQALKILYLLSRVARVKDGKIYQKR